MWQQNIDVNLKQNIALGLMFLQALLRPNYHCRP